MSEPFEFPNDSEDEREANKEEENTLAARDTWFGLANSTTHHLKVANTNTNTGWQTRPLTISRWKPSTNT